MRPISQAHNKLQGENTVAFRSIHPTLCSPAYAGDIVSVSQTGVQNQFGTPAGFANLAAAKSVLKSMVKTMNFKGMLSNSKI